ncbi:MAG: CocE/NonD family hydrolase [Planctomycetota bacterium]
MRRTALPFLALGPLLAAALHAQDKALLERYAAATHLVPMRDGVKLHTIVVSRKDAPAPLPIVLLRTPYGVANWQRFFGGLCAELAADGYTFVFQDLRGKFGSEGTFVMQRPLRATDPALTIDEGTDAYDTIDWLLANGPANNGKVGMLGVSYDGWTTIMAAVDPHPALTAISPQASPADMWIGDDFHHNGAFRLSYGFEYATMMETAKATEPFRFPRHDVFDWYLELGSLANVNERFLKGRIPTWNDFVAHPDNDDFWRAQTIVPHLRACTVPTLNVAGWWDQEDFYGPLAIYRALEQHDQRGINYLVVGPWNHGGWSRGDGDRLGRIAFGAPTARWFREQVQAVWFRHWLKGEGKLDLPEALTFEPGNNAWRHWDRWPPAAAVATPLYLHAGKAVSFEPPAEAGDDAFVSDPAHPVPYRQRPIQATYGAGSKWRDWLVEDQRFLLGRPDVLAWESAPLTADLTIAGTITAKLWCGTTGTDADWVVKLIDVYPDDHKANGELTGHCLMVANDVLRGRYRSGLGKPEPWPANEPVAITIDLHAANYTWQAGHRVMVQVHSTWFPLIDRNPQTYVPNIFLAADADFQAQTHRVFHGSKTPSQLVLPVVAR